MSAALNETQAPKKSVRTLLTPRKMQTTKPTASLTLAVKKKEILVAELAKLETDLQYRTELLERLQLRHEQLLTSNGHLQEQKRLRREKLSALQSALHDTKLLVSEQTTPSCNRDSSPNEELAADQQREDMKEFDTSAEKIAVVSSLLQGLDLRRVHLEQECMALEETTSRHVSTINWKYLALREAQETQSALREDIAATELSCQMEQHEIEHVEARIQFSSQLISEEHDQIDHFSATLADCNKRIADLQNTSQTYHAMAGEDIIQLQHSMNEQKRTLQIQERLLDRNGATCTKDEEIEQVSKDLLSKLSKLNEQIISEKYHAREALLLVKQEKKIISILKGNIRSKESQLIWLQRQQAHHDNEYDQMVTAASAKEHDYNEFLSSYNLQSDNLGDRLKVLSEMTAAVDNELSTCMNNTAAIHQQIKSKQESLQNHHTTLESKENDILHFQTLLNDTNKITANIAKEISTQNERNEQLQKQISTYEMQSEDMKLSEHSIEDAITISEQQSSAVANDTIKTTSFINEAIEEFRAKFFPPFDRDQILHAQNILKDEVARMRSEEQRIHDEFTKRFQEKSRMLERQHEERILHLKAKLRDASKQKENEYDALFATLTEKQEKAKANKQVHGSPQTFLLSHELETHLDSVVTTTTHKIMENEETRSLQDDVAQKRNQVPEEIHSQDDVASFENDNAEPNTRPSQVNTKVLAGANLTKMIDDIYQSNAAIDDQFRNSPQKSQVTGHIRRGHKLNEITTSPAAMAARFVATSKQQQNSRAARLLESKIPKAIENNSQFDEASCFAPEAAKKRNTVSKVRAARRPRPKMTKVSKKVNEDNAKSRPGLNEPGTLLNPINGDKRTGSKENGTHKETNQINDMLQQNTFPKSKEAAIPPKASAAKKTTVRRLTTSRITKSRPQPASQCVDWFANDTFSFD